MLPKLGFALCALSCLSRVLLAAAGDSCNVNILNGSLVYVEYDGSLTLNCNSSCKDIRDMNWETSLKKDVDKGDQWTSVKLNNIMLWNTRVICYAMLQNGETAQQNITIITYRPPTSVNISLDKETMEVNRSYPITCHIPNVAPLRNTRVTFLRGEETLHVVTFENSTTVDGVDLLVTHNHIAQEADHHMPFKCLVALDLQPQGELFREFSRNVTVRTFALPEKPTIHMLKYIEKGSEVTAECQVSGVFPPEEVNLSLMLSGEDVNATVKRMNDTVTAEARVTPSSLELPVQCSATLWDEVKMTQDIGYVYTFSQPVLQLTDASTKMGNNVTINCSLAEAKPASVQFIVTAGGAPLSCEEGSLFQRLCTLTVQREDHAKEVVCKVQLQLPEQIISKQASVRLNVTYGPAFSNSDCPSVQTLVEGRMSTIRCQSEGNPAPQIECTKDGNGRWDFTRADSGTYLCTATNSEGSADRNVTVKVEYQPTISTIELNEPKDVITKGKTITLRCLASGLPHPKYQWSIPKAESVTYSPDNSMITIHDAQTHHSGSYACNVTNIHGSHRKEKTIHIRDPLQTILAAILGTAAGCALLTAAVGYYLYYRAQKIRKYKLQRAGKSPAGQKLMPNGTSSAAP
ncbi:intercellular adhesion molecule 5 [Microcaecilia unicolor]|uniref:Intercellular adhesion molecule 5-like n=1 Tax=Microcaecilia unicolor TaxID=1415580 RepID=A0A6P7XIA1_9AMPH|nr:intercellular adhesion molecule 5-like [Microcaecilia unicolor]